MKNTNKNYSSKIGNKSGFYQKKTKKGPKKGRASQKKGLLQGKKWFREEGGHNTSLFVTFFKKALPLNDNILRILSR